jgi:hypothetical protein
MCYETYERLLRARALRRGAERPTTPDREEPRPETHKTPLQPVTAVERVQTREDEPA